MHEWDVRHVVRACCPCGYQTDLQACGCDIGRDVSWDERKQDEHAGLQKAVDAAQGHLQSTGHALPVLEHRFLVTCSCGFEQDYRAYPEAVAAAEEHAGVTAAA